MPRERRNERLLPPATISRRLLEKVEDSIPASLRGYVTWNVGFGNDSVTAAWLGELLEEIKDERHFDVLSLEVLDSDNKDHEWLLWCDSDGSSISYNIARGREGDFRTLTDEVDRLFKTNRRLRARVPGMFRLWSFLKEPMFLIGMPLSQYGLS